MAEIETSVLRIGSNDLVLQDSAVRGSLAAAYSASSTYAVGDMVLKDGQLYECNTAISTAEAWTAAHWTAVTVGDEIATVKDGFDDLDDRVTALEEGGSGSGLTEDIKQALLQIAAKVVYIDDDGQDYYDALEEALYPPADLVSISAVYTQSGTVYDTDTLDSLKADLVVTATYDDSSTATVTAYTLSGTLTEGTSTITVAYGGKTDTFDVTVTHSTGNLLYSWDFTQSMIDTVQNVEATTNATQVSTGISFDATGQRINLLPSQVSILNKRIEIDVASAVHSATNKTSRLFGVAKSNTQMTTDADVFAWRNNGYGWYQYVNGWSSNYLAAANYSWNWISGKTVVLTYDDEGYLTVSVNGVDLITYSNKTTRTGYLMVGGGTGDEMYTYQPVIAGVRIYEVTA